MGNQLEMTLLEKQISFYTASDRQSIPKKPLEFLKSLSGISVYDIIGKDQANTRVITTLIHGNEPSGLIACHLWLRSNETPTTNVRIIFCNPEAAKTKPYFTNRYLSQNDDLNRYFTKASIVTNEKRENICSVTNRAKQIISLIKPSDNNNPTGIKNNLEAILDLHNTSGASPAFAVSIQADKKHCQLAEFFTDNMIQTNIHVGAIMEQQFNAPIVTIECGGANENKSHQVATIGVQNFLDRVSLFDGIHCRVSVRNNPLRVELTDDSSVGFSNHPLQTTDLTFRADIETLNNGITPVGEFIGWTSNDKTLLFEAFDLDGNNHIEKLFEIRGECIYTLVEIQFYMITCVPEIATKDCLFYITTIN